MIFTLKFFLSFQHWHPLQTYISIHVGISWHEFPMQAILWRKKHRYASTPSPHLNIPFYDIVSAFNFLFEFCWLVEVSGIITIHIITISSVEWPFVVNKLPEEAVFNPFLFKYIELLSTFWNCYFLSPWRTGCTRLCCQE